MRSILFKLSDLEADELDAALEVLRETDPKITTPRKLFLRAVHHILDGAGVSVEERTEYVAWVPPDRPALSPEEQVAYDARLAALID